MGANPDFSMRGQKLYNEILNNDGRNQPEQKGRNETLLSRRNKCLLARFYYYGHYKKKKYDSILELLVAEFFLSEERIYRIITQNAMAIKDMKTQEWSLYQLQSYWPQFRW